MADLRPGDGDAERLRRHWLTSPKIRWGTPGDHGRCVRELNKYMPGRAEGYCANLHKRATGVYPGDKRNIGRRG